MPTSKFEDPAINDIVMKVTRNVFFQLVKEKQLVAKVVQNTAEMWLERIFTPNDDISADLSENECPYINSWNVMIPEKTKTATGNMAGENLSIPPFFWRIECCVHFKNNFIMPCNFTNRPML